MDQAHCGPFILCNCSHGAFIWLQVTVNLEVRFLKNVSDQDDAAQREISQLRQGNHSPDIMCSDKAEKPHNLGIWEMIIIIIIIIIIISFLFNVDIPSFYRGFFNGCWKLVKNFLC